MVLSKKLNLSFKKHYDIKNDCIVLNVTANKEFMELIKKFSVENEIVDYSNSSFLAYENTPIRQRTLIKNTLANSGCFNSQFNILFDKEFLKNGSVDIKLQDTRILDFFNYENFLRVKNLVKTLLELSITKEFNLSFELIEGVKNE